ncbi:MAG TPA: 3-isopropylmalate dehydratase small subunit [Alphaproteobacteria bacterium]|nr:3-isopropylmalate dehydratase small subunit [Alphaproteobacteria bacterium]
MKKFETFTGVAAPMPAHNIDTDKIIPARFLKTIQRAGLGKYLFNDQRFTEDGNEKPDFVLNKGAYRNAEILVVGDNFGCGSSREHAPWALSDFGIKCIIGTDFADIFFNNSFKNGMLLIKLPKEVVDELMDDAQKGANARLTVDLETQEITRPNGEKVRFDVESFRKHCLLNGLDDIGLTMEKNNDINNFERKDDQHRPWAPEITAG